MLSKENKIILIGFGNIYRKDDGLGLALIDRMPSDIQKLEVPEISIDLVETVKDFDIVVFVDAAVDGENFTFREITLKDSTFPLSHHMSCEELLVWTRALYKVKPKAYLLSIRGYDFDFGEEISEKAKKNLEEASAYLRTFINEIIQN